MMASSNSSSFLPTTAGCVVATTATTLLPTVPRLAVRGTQIVDTTTGVVTTLRGVSYGWHNWWPRFYHRDTVAWLQQDWGVTVVRAAMGVHYDDNHDDDDACVDEAARLQSGIETISKVIEGAISNGIYVIIDFHSHVLDLELAKTFFVAMATKYGQCYPNILYEIFNEPIHDSWEDVKTYAQDVIATIRAIDPHNLILVGSPHWDQDVHLVADDPITDPQHDHGHRPLNILYTLHYYAASHGAALRERGEYAIARGIPLFISESAGTDASGDGGRGIDYEEWQRWREWADTHAISSVTWSLTDKANERCSMLQPHAASTGGWSPEEDLTEAGRATRAILRAYYSTTVLEEE